MSEPGATTVCLRCGDFLGAATIVVPGVALCAECLAEGPLERGGQSIFPHVGAGVIVLATVGAVAALGALLGLWSATRWGGDPVAGIFGGLLAVLAAVLLLLPFCWRIESALTAKLKRDILARVGLTERAGAPLPVMKLAWRPTRFPLCPHDLGVVVESAHGLAFLGLLGTRAKLVFHDVATAKLCVRYDELATGWVAVELRDGRALWLGFSDRGSLRENRRAAEALAGRIQGRIGGGVVS